MDSSWNSSQWISVYCRESPAHDRDSPTYDDKSSAHDSSSPAHSDDEQLPQLDGLTDNKSIR